MMARIAPAFAGAVGGAPRVSLLPRSEVDRRERAVLTRKWFWVVFAAIVVAAVAIGAAFALNMLAQQRLVAEQAKTSSLISTIGSMSDVSQMQAAQKELESFTSDAMGNDLSWRAVLAKIDTALPHDVSLTGFNVTAGALPQASIDPATMPGLTGSFTYESPNALDIAALIRSLRAIPGVLDADGTSVTGSTTQQDSFVYELDVTFDQSIYTGAHTTGAN